MPYVRAGKELQFSISTMFTFMTIMAMSSTILLPLKVSTVTTKLRLNNWTGTTKFLQLFSILFN